MAWMGDDPLSGDVPHRDLIDEEDEAQARELAPQYVVPPVVQWGGAAVPQDPTLVFLLGRAACLLLDAFFPGTQVVGSVSVPELVRVLSPLEEEYGSSQQPLNTCTLRAAPGGGNDLLLAACPRDLPAEQAAAWAAAVLAALAPARVLVAATLPAMSYRGPGDPADQDLVFSLQTAAAAAAAAGSGSGSDSGAALPPPLPEATVAGGLPAALLARCELDGLPATLVAGVKAQQVPDAGFLYALGRGLQAALQAAGAGQSPAAAAAAAQGVQSPRAQLVAALGAAADAVYRSSASASIFV